MNVLMVFPKYDILSLLEQSALDRFIKKCDKFIESVAQGGHKLFFIAENDTARNLSEDVPNARFLSLTNDYDADLVAICSDLSDLVYPSTLSTVNYAVSTGIENFTDMAKFEAYYLDNIQKAYEGLQNNMNLVVEFAMANKHMRFRTKDIPTSCFYYKYDVNKSEGFLYVAGQYNEELTELWRGGIPNEK